ncbi:MAG: enoyl-CoA hydratase/isomerase family protein [Anaerolineae bacterium]
MIQHKGQPVTDLGTPETLLLEQRQFTLYITLNRPRTRNAMNNQMVAELTDIFARIHGDRTIRAIVLQGSDGTFCSGGDIKEMRNSDITLTDSANNLDRMLSSVNQAPQIVIARVEGSALGGGFGLVCVSDIALADAEAIFGLPEVRLGVAPSFISPYVIKRIGLTRARELMLTGRRFGGHVAKEYGIVHEVHAASTLDNALTAQIEEISACAPGAIAAIKNLIFAVDGMPLEATVALRADLLDALRRGEEAQEGLLAFMEKRPAQWMIGANDD